MRFLSSLTLIAAVLVATSIGEKVTYNGFKLVRVFPNNAEDVKFIQELELNDGVDIWHAHGDEVEVMLSPAQLNKYKKTLNARKINFKVLSDNVQDLIDQEQRSMSRSGVAGKNILFKFARYSEINNFIEDIVEENSDIASVRTAGVTRENRLLKVVTLRTAPRQKAIWIDCGIHAREWVTPATCVYIINQFVKEIRDFQPQTQAIFDKYEIHILPLVNPDGYEYCHTTTRLWRKNRTPNAGSTCNGTDLNRNYGFQWLTNGGASANPCSDLYAGSRANSELETQAIISSINARPNDWDAFLTIHSYGNWWLTPFGYTATPPPDYADIKAAGDAGAAAILNYNGTKFTVGPSSTLLYVNSGSSKDWAYGVAKIKYSYVLELRPGSGTPDAGFGFVLPEDRLPLVAPETFAGVKGFIGHILNKI